MGDRLRHPRRRLKPVSRSIQAFATTYTEARLTLPAIAGRSASSAESVTNGADVMGRREHARNEQPSFDDEEPVSGGPAMVAKTSVCRLPGLPFLNGQLFQVEPQPGTAASAVVLDRVEGSANRAKGRNGDAQSLAVDEALQDWMPIVR